MLIYRINVIYIWIDRTTTVSRDDYHTIKKRRKVDRTSTPLIKFVSFKLNPFCNFLFSSRNPMTYNIIYRPCHVFKLYSMY